VQVGVPLVPVQRLLQEPQVLGEERSTSQPLAGLMSQSAKPGLQVKTQAPTAQALEALAALQRLLQRPQFSAETLVSMH
jgi:phosphotransferase system HPr-like phosphotransfer protein